MKIAVVGSGISGLSAAWLCQRAGHDVTLFESANYLGGHSNTIEVTLEGITHPVDTGFLVHNPQTYPQLIALFDFLNVEVVETDMTFSVRLDEKKLEWAGTNLFTVFSQKKNLFKFSFWKMILDILKFNKEARVNLRYSREHQLSLGELLSEKKYSREFRDWYLIPMGAAIWSTSTEEMLKFPAETFLQFCINHSLLQVEGRPVWRTVKNGSREYVKKMAQSLANIHLNERVIAVTRGDSVSVRTEKAEYLFDKIIFAAHADQTVAMIKDLTDEESKILTPVRYQPNTAYVHWDEKLLPQNKDVWSAWNYLSQKDGLNKSEVCVSYLINKLQPLPFNQPIIVTLNPYVAPEKNKIIQKIEYHHPVFDQACIDSQSLLHSIQGKNHSYFAGAWSGYGFHEDGLKSGMAVAKLLGVKIPW